MIEVDSFLFHIWGFGLFESFISRTPTLTYKGFGLFEYIYTLHIHTILTISLPLHIHRTISNNKHDLSFSLQIPLLRPSSHSLFFSRPACRRPQGRSCNIKSRTHQRWDENNG